MGITKALNLSNMRLEDYLVDKYGLFLDLRSNDDNNIHGSGRRIENASEGITIQLKKAAETAGEIKLLHLHHYGRSTQYRKWSIPFRNMLYII